MNTRLYSLVCLLFVSLAGCHPIDDIFYHIRDKDHQERSFTTHEIFTVPLFVADKNGDTPTDPHALVYENRKMNPILAPDGHQLTWGEFDAARGSLTMTCTPNGTRLHLDVEGLVPYGTYTMWVVVFDASGTPPLLAAGTDDTQGLFVANADGRATYSAMVSEGELSDFSSVSDCLLDEPVVRIFGAYHIDGRTYGGLPGPAGTYLEQFGWSYHAE